MNTQLFAFIFLITALISTIVSSISIYCVMKKERLSDQTTQEVHESKSENVISKQEYMDFIAPIVIAAENEKKDMSKQYSEVFAKISGLYYESLLLKSGEPNKAETAHDKKPNKTHLYNYIKRASPKNTLDKKTLERLIKIYSKRNHISLDSTSIHDRLTLIDKYIQEGVEDENNELTYTPDILQKRES